MSTLVDGRVRTGAAFARYYDTAKRRQKARSLLTPATGKKRNTDNSYKIRERHLRHLEEILKNEGITHLQYLRQEHIDRAFEECVESINPRIDSIPAPNTLKAIVASLKTFVRYHAERGAIPASRVVDLLENLPTIKNVNRRMLIIKGECWPEIFALAQDRHWTDRILLELGYRLAMRLSEAISVRWRDFSDDFSEVTYYRDKLNDFHTCKTNPMLRDALHEYHAWLTEMLGYPPPRDWTIVLARKRSGGQGARVEPWWEVNPGQPMEVRSAWQAIKHALVAYGIKPEEMLCQAMHIARRSRACHLFRLHVDIRIIAKILGHETYLTTLTYIRDGLDEEEIQAAMDLPDKVAPKVLAIGSVHDLSPGENLALPVAPHGKEVLADATLAFLQSGLLSEAESKVMLMRILNACP